jgi:hypothetical protein
MSVYHELLIITTQYINLYLTQTFMSNCCEQKIYPRTYHSRSIPEGAAEPSQIFLPDAHILPKSTTPMEERELNTSSRKKIFFTSRVLAFHALEEKVFF